MKITIDTTEKTISLLDGTVKFDELREFLCTAQLTDYSINTYNGLKFTTTSSYPAVNTYLTAPTIQDYFDKYDEKLKYVTTSNKI